MESWAGHSKIQEGLNGVPLKSLISKNLVQKSLISKILARKSLISKKIAKSVIIALIMYNYVR